MYFNGMKVLESQHAVKRYQFRFPRCKSKRIAKKFRKKDSNFKTEPCVLVMDNINTMMAHPLIYKQMQTQLPKSAGPFGVYF